MASLRIGATLAVIGVTVGELVGGETGLGYLISFGQGQANTSMVFDAIILLTVIGIVMYWAVAYVEARVLHYVPRALDVCRRIHDVGHGVYPPCHRPCRGYRIPAPAGRCAGVFRGPAARHRQPCRQFHPADGGAAGDLRCRRLECARLRGVKAIGFGVADAARLCGG